MTTSSSALTGTSGNDILIGTNKSETISGGAGNDIIIAGNGSDILDGGSGNDIIFGGNGSDIIYAGAGNDWAFGGNGNDTFYHAMSANIGSVDFLNGENGKDTLVLQLTSGQLAQPDVQAAIAAFNATPKGCIFDFSTYVTNMQLKVVNIEKLVIQQVANTAPIANSDVAITNEDQAVVVNVLSNDSDPDGDSLSILSFDQTSAGGAVITQVGNTLSYNPGTAYNFLAQGQVTADTFHYTIADGQGGTTTALVTVTITGVNDGPVANAENASTLANAAVDINVLANDSDPDQGDVLSVVSAVPTAALPAGAALSVVNGMVHFDPGHAYAYLGQGQTAQVSFTYTIQDLFGATANATDTITITGVNDAPIANTENASTLANAAIDINVLANDSDPDQGDTISLVNVAPIGALPAGASLSIVNGMVHFDPGHAYDGLLQGQIANLIFNYTVQDSFGATATATNSITITGVNVPFFALPETVTTDQNTPININVLANDSGNNLTVLGASVINNSLPVGASLSVVNGMVHFDPGTAYLSLAQGETAQLLFAYTVQDNGLNQSTAIDTINITGLNDTPRAVAESAVTNESTAINLNVLANDSDPDNGAVLSIANLTPLNLHAGASLSVVNGLVHFDPGTGYTNLVTGQNTVLQFTYQAQDQFGALSNTVTDSILIQGIGPGGSGDTGGGGGGGGGGNDDVPPGGLPGTIV